MGAYGDSRYPQKPIYRFRSKWSLPKTLTIATNQIPRIKKDATTYSWLHETIIAEIPKLTTWAKRACLTHRPPEALVAVKAGKFEFLAGTANGSALGRGITALGT